MKDILEDLEWELCGKMYEEFDKVVIDELDAELNSELEEKLTAELYDELCDELRDVDWKNICETLWGAPT